MTDNVVARSKLGGKNSGDLELVLDQRVCNPSSWADNGGLRDFGPAESTGGQSGAVACRQEVISKAAYCTGSSRWHTVARRNVVYNRPLVTIRPSVPLKLDGVSRIDVSVETSRSGTLVAVHICCADRCGLDETDVLVQCIQACGLGATVLWEVVPHGVGAVGEGAFYVDTLDEPVGGCCVEKDSDGAEEECGCVHREVYEGMVANVVALMLICCTCFYLLLYAFHVLDSLYGFPWYSRSETEPIDRSFQVSQGSHSTVR